MGSSKILGEVNAYYTDKITRFGATPRGVDWNGEEGQNLRFEQLSKIIVPGKKAATVLDYGCGHGSLYTYLSEQKTDFRYHGFDISHEMIAHAKARKLKHANWSTAIPAGKQFDYTIASGVFNVRLRNSNKAWLAYIIGVLNEMDAVSKKGFSFNMLTKYSDKPYMKDYLYYADPCFIFDYCKKHFSKHVALLHDYPLYEFSILVRKSV